MTYAEALAALTAAEDAYGADCQAVRIAEAAFRRSRSAKRAQALASADDAARKALATVLAARRRSNLLWRIEARAAETAKRTAAASVQLRLAL